MENGGKNEGEAVGTEVEALEGDSATTQYGERSAEGEGETQEERRESSLFLEFCLWMHESAYASGMASW